MALLHKSRVRQDRRWLGLLVLFLVLYDSCRSKGSCGQLLLSSGNYNDDRVVVTGCLVFATVVMLFSADHLGRSC